MITGIPRPLRRVAVRVRLMESPPLNAIARLKMVPADFGAAVLLRLTVPGLRPPVGAGGIVPAIDGPRTIVAMLISAVRAVRPIVGRVVRTG